MILHTRVPPGIRTCWFDYILQQFVLRPRKSCEKHNGTWFPTIRKKTRGHQSYLVWFRGPERIHETPCDSVSVCGCWYDYAREREQKRKKGLRMSVVRQLCSKRAGENDMWTYIHHGGYDIGVRDMSEYKAWNCLHCCWIWTYLVAHGSRSQHFSVISRPFFPPLFFHTNYTINI